MTTLPIPTTTTTNTTTDNKEKNDIIIITSSLSSSSSLKLERKIAIATEGLNDYVVKRLSNLKTSENIETICNYIIAMNAEINPAIMYRKNQILILCHLSEYHSSSYSHNNNNDNNQTTRKFFRQITRNDILSYLDSLRRPEASDPQHKWIGTYNLR